MRSTPMHLACLPASPKPKLPRFSNCSFRLNGQAGGLQTLESTCTLPPTHPPTRAPGNGIIDSVLSL